MDNDHYVRRPNMSDCNKDQTGDRMEAFQNMFAGIVLFVFGLILFWLGLPVGGKLAFVICPAFLGVGLGGAIEPRLLWPAPQQEEMGSARIRIGRWLLHVGAFGASAAMGLYFSWPELERVFGRG